jgi:hypothetical protein
VRAASSKGKTGRGRNIICAILDESCFFFDAGYVVNDEDIYRAIAPRVVRGGQLIVQSTPWGKQGLLYDLWSRNFGSPQTCIAVHASTRAMRSDADQLAKIDAEYQRDPENARREFGAEFLDTDAQYLASDHIDACTRVDGDEAPIRGVAYVACVDPASRSNAFTLAIGRRTYDGGVAVSLVRQWLPERGSPLDLRAVVGEVAALAKRYGCDEVVSRFEIVNGELLQSYEPHDLPGAFIVTRHKVTDPTGAVPSEAIQWSGPGEWPAHFPSQYEGLAVPRAKSPLLFHPGEFLPRACE